MRKQIYPTKNSCRGWLKGLEKRKIVKKKKKEKRKIT